MGIPLEAIHLILDVSALLDTRLASLRCHRTQLSSEWDAVYASQEMAVDLLGKEYLIQADPPGPDGTTLDPDMFAGLRAED